MKRVAIHLLSRNGSKYFPFLLGSLKKQLFTDWFLFVADNGSTIEESQSMQEAIKESAITEFSFVRFEKNLGFSGGHNKLFASHEAELVLLLNDDAFLEENYLLDLVNFIDKNSQVGAVSGRIYRWDFDQYKNNRGGRTDVLDTIGLERLINGQVVDIGAGELDQASNSSHHNQVVFGVSGCLPLYRRSMILKTSPEGTLFDTSFGTYKEDVELAYRLQDGGFLAYTVASAKAFHRRTFSKESKTQQPFENLLYSYRNHLWVLVMHLSNASLGVSKIRVVIFECGKMIYWLFKKPNVVIFAVFQTIWNLPSLLRKRRFFAKLRQEISLCCTI